ncbi:MAG: tRNA glutamyl-Q(34) synthetase GluQRS [Fimbriimonadaceae bacterium]
MAVRTRFAPSPTGFLHLGHALSAWHCHRAGHPMLLRIEDIDPERSRPEYVDAIFEDLAWLGLCWPEPVLRQSERFAAYEQAIAKLEGEGLVYPCFMSRAGIQREYEKLGSVPMGPDGPIYPGTHRHLSPQEAEERKAAGEPYNLRLNVAEAVKRTGPLRWHDRTAGEQTAEPEAFGDFVIARKDVPTSYHLSVVVDDAYQEIDLVTRGMYLFQSTHVHRLLQALLGLPVPEYDHHALLTDREGDKLGKSKASKPIRAYREAGVAAQELWRRLGLDPPASG